MTHFNIYGKYESTLNIILDNIISQIKTYNDMEVQKSGEKAYEHLIYRVKDKDSMLEKCTRKNLPQTTYSALHDIQDAIGIRIICRFIDDIYKNIDYLKSLPNLKIIKEKDYIKNVKPNGYRSYHLIVEITAPYEDILGNNPGKFFAEIQVRTIAMDSWASLEHQMKYKHDIKNPELIVKELKRCADELAACDVSMQTIRNLINAEN
ncbi:GTP pyrophosphokinase family protein [Megamonas funiformis]|jgi:putative GTP pyrophosphokinase|uniref:GTP pyrophosphokinase n=1 Tax=Megamonas funiformis TaxID=437897 RepID=UPI001430E2D0|nr:GTP pyrophosphokinase family protein [Megamonas funiformis]NJE28443.1 GTP pyrophosphokinase family protein [Megamonas funiformis]